MSKHKGRRIRVKGIFDDSGRPIEFLPEHPSASFMRRTFMKGERGITVAADGITVNRDITMMRAQRPYMVTLLVYKSQFEMMPTAQEFFLYAPSNLKHPSLTALNTWRRWFKKKTKEARTLEELKQIQIVEDLRNDYPKVDDGAVAEPIDDKFFDECWKQIRGRGNFKAGGDPRDPWIFTSTDPGFRVYRAEDFQRGLIHTL